MPFIVKTSLHIDTPKSEYDHELNKIDFINDPDVIRDALPQPYKRIDKILNELLEEVWEVIEKRESEKIAESKKPRPSKYDNLFLLENVENVSCVCPSTDEDASILFVCANNTSIHAVDAQSLKICDKIQIEDGSQNILSVTCSSIKQSVFLVAAITDIGTVNMFLFFLNKFYPVQAIGDAAADGKTGFIKCELSEKTDYMALLVESKLNSNEAPYIEIYKFAKEIWSQQIETVIDKKSKLIEAAANEDVLEHESTTAAAQQQRDVFPKPVLFCRMRAPANQTKIQPINTLNMNQVLKATENSDMIGLGVNHVFSKMHLDLKNELAEALFNVNIPTEPVVNQNAADVKFKFIYPNRFVPTPSTEPDIPNSLMVCWNDTNQLLFYTFSKIPKDLEIKVEVNIPFTSEIVHVEIAKHSTLIAVALKNNNVVVIDMIAGIDRQCVHLDVGSIKSLNFLPAFHGLDNNDFRNIDFHLKVNTQLLCLADDGRVFAVDCTLSNKHQPKVVYTPKYNNKDDKLCLLLPCRHVPSLALVLGVTNKLYLLDLFKGIFVCELNNPSSEGGLVKLNEISLAARNKILFVKCDNDSTKVSKLFAHTLRLIPKLEDYFADANENLYSSNYLPNCSLNERIKVLMKQRTNEQYYRKERLMANWSKLHEQKNIN